MVSIKTLFGCNIYIISYYSNCSSYYFLFRWLFLLSELLLLLLFCFYNVFSDIDNQTSKQNYGNSTNNNSATNSNSNNIKAQQNENKIKKIIKYFEQKPMVCNRSFLYFFLPPPLLPLPSSLLSFPPSSFLYFFCKYTDCSRNPNIKLVGKMEKAQEISLEISYATYYLYSYYSISNYTNK